MDENIRHSIIKIANNCNATENDIISFDIVVDFLSQFPDSLSLKTKFSTGSKEYWERIATKFFRARKLIQDIKESSTIPDEMVSYILKICFNYSVDELERIKKEHQLSMSVENKIGELLERYLASVLEPLGWTWCSGDFVKSIDFIRKNNQTWVTLQVKNRNNTENSSSGQVRRGTSICKWHRSSSKSDKTRWEKFPDKIARSYLSEEGFKVFVINYFLEVQKLNQQT